MEGVPPWSAMRPLPFSSLFPRLQHRIVTKVQLVPVLASTAHGRYLLGQQPVKVRTARRRPKGPLHSQLFLFLALLVGASRWCRAQARRWIRTRWPDRSHAEGTYHIVGALAPPHSLPSTRPPAPPG